MDSKSAKPSCLEAIITGLLMLGIGFAIDAGIALLVHSAFPTIFSFLQAFAVIFVAGWLIAISGRAFRSKR